MVDWAAGNHRLLYRAMVLFLAACAGLNAWFLPSSSYYHKEFTLRQPFSKAARDRGLGEAAPVRDVIAWFNEHHRGAAVLFTHDSLIAGTAGDIYANHWHQWPNYQRIQGAATVDEMLQLLKSWKIEYFIAQKREFGERIKPKQLARLVELCGVPEYQRGDMYLARLDPACDPAAARVAPAAPSVTLTRGFYDDSDPALIFDGEWEHDESFPDTVRKTISYNNVPGAEIRFAFHGKGFQWIFTKAPNRGIAEITIDGVGVEPVDLYDSGIVWQNPVRFCCFQPGRHVVAIKVSGKSNAKASGRYVDLDAIIIE
jgi:hypothetical protein